MRQQRIVGVVATAAGAAAMLTFTTIGAASPAAKSGVPTNTKPPSISGAPREGSKVTADRGKWNGGSIDFTYQWERCDSAGANCSNISDATTKHYTLTASDVNRRLRVVVTGTNSDGSSTAASAQTVAVTPRGSADQIKLPNGLTSISITSVAPPQRLIVDRIEYSPSRIVSRDTPLVVRLRIIDTRGYVVRGALVYAVGVPFNRISRQPETSTDTGGWATITFRLLPALALRPGNLLVLFVRARKGGESVLAGVSTRRLVSIRLG